MGALALSSKKTSSQLVSDSKSSIEEICTGRLLSLKAIIAFVSKMKSKYDVHGTLDWQTIIGHFADANATKKKLPKKRDGTENKDRKDGKVAKAKALPAEKKAAKSKDKTVTQVAQNLPKVKPLKTKKIEEEIDEPSEEPAATTMADPFFITNDGSNYMSTAVIDRTQPDGPDDALNRRSRRANRLPNNSDGAKSHVKTGKFNKSTPKLKSFGGSARNETKQDAEADVHPSWSAKRKQKSIPAFQGKKMKFDGSEDKPAPGSAKPANDGDDSSKLHPSWAAKQKLKPVIAAFKGSKITFD